MRKVTLVQSGAALLTLVFTLLIALAEGPQSQESMVEAAADADGAEPGAIASPSAGTFVTASPIPGPGSVHRVDIVADDYEPGGLHVRVGDTVRWVNRDGVTHTVTANDGSFNSGPMHRGGVFSHTFTEAGSYRYSCDLHLEMSGAVVASGT